MLKCEQIKREIQERFGFFPPFFEPALETPEVLENLWQQTLSAYVNNPLPALFKEKLFAYLSRYCSVPYCIICHSCALRPLGMTAKEVLELLEEPVTTIACDLEAQIMILQSQSEPLTAWPELNSVLERSLYRASILVFLRPYHAHLYRSELRRILGTFYYTHLMAFLAYIKMCYQWVECYPELSYQADRRAQLHLAPLLQEIPELADFFDNYNQKVQQEKPNWENEITNRIVELQRVEKALGESEKKSQLLVNSVRDVIFQTDASGKWTFLNPAWYEITGFTVEESIGTNFLDYVHYDDQLHNLKQFQPLIERQEEFCRYEVRYLNKNKNSSLSSPCGGRREGGGYRWIEVYAQLIFASDGTIAGTCGTLKDISDRKAAEIALQQSNNLLCAVIEGTTDAIFLKDLQGRYAIVNSAGAHNIGKRVEEIIGKDDSELFSKETARQLMETDRRIMASGQSEILEEIVTINNITQTYLSTKDVYRDSQGNVIGLIGISRDISDRKRLELEREQLLEQLRRDSEDLAALSNVTANAISTLNLEELLNVLLQRIVQVAKVDTAVFLLKEGDRLRVRASIGVYQEVHSSFTLRIGEGFAGTIAASGQPLYIEDAQTDSRVTSQIIKHLNIRSMLGVPMKRNGNLVGVLHVDWLKIHPFSDRLVHLLEITAERCAMAILNAQLYEQTRQLQERLQLQIDLMPIGCILHDKDFHFIEWNPAAERIFGFTRQEVLGKHPWDLIIPPSARAFADRIFRQILTGDITADGTYKNITKDGRTIICEWYNRPLKDADDNVIGLLSMVQDVTDRIVAEEALRDSEKRYRSLFQSNPHPMWVFDCETLAFLDVNEAAIQHYGYSRDEFLAMTIRDIRPPEDIPSLQENLSQIGSGYYAMSVWRHRKKDGTIIYVEISSHILVFLGKPARVVLANDITARKQAEEQLRRYAYYNPLTGLPNRTLFLEQLGQLINLGKRGEVDLFAVLLLSLNRFQMVKYSLGHHVADRLLVTAASRLQTCLQKNRFSVSSELEENSLPYSQTTLTIQNSILTQVGPDEFAIILTNLQKVGDATRIADRICQEMTLPFNLDKQEVFISASIGITFSSIGYDRPEDFLSSADTAMNHSKKLGKAPYAIFEPGWQTLAVQRLQLETELRRATERGELRVYYQPIVSLKTGQITGFEALVRWQHPTRGFVSPADFIPLAEETGLIGLIDRWVLREACRQVAVWQQKFPSDEPLTISVNLSAIELAQLGLIERIDQVLQETDIYRYSLKLEITETSLLGNTVGETAMLQQLKNLGIQLSIDDFGTGYSSFARLHQLPIDTLKIDRSFVSQMGEDSESLEIVRTIVSLAHILDMDVIAEGVETAEQLAQLKLLECEYGQGYFFSRPVDSKAAEALLAASNQEKAHNTDFKHGCTDEKSKI